MNQDFQNGPKKWVDLQQQEATLFRRTKPLGDALFLTTAAREIRKRTPNIRLKVYSHWPDLFINNPDVFSSHPIREPAVPEGHEITYENPWPPARRCHVLKIVCESLGLNGDEIDPRIYYHPTDEERARAHQIRPPGGKPLVVVHPFSGFFAARTKQWHFSNWKSFLDLIPNAIETMRFSNPDDPATPTERPFHRDIQTADIRLQAALLESADAFVGQESGLAHLATALGVPAVVIFTGYVPPDVFGYAQNINLVPENLPYIPCWQGDGCPPCGGDICTRAVSPERALDALLELLKRRGKI
jgi:ADP-heptose:LPS heptosyltransferase